MTLTTGEQLRLDRADLVTTVLRRMIDLNLFGPNARVLTDDDPGNDDTPASTRVSVVKFNLNGAVMQANVDADANVWMRGVESTATISALGVALGVLSGDISAPALAPRWCVEAEPGVWTVVRDDEPRDRYQSAHRYGTRTDCHVCGDTTPPPRPTMVTAAVLPVLLAAAPVTLRVDDPEDPCGGRKIARRLKAAYQDSSADAFPARGAAPEDRWMLVFGGPYLHRGNLMLPTTAGTRHELTDDDPQDPGPCDDCRSQAAEMWSQT